MVYNREGRRKHFALATGDWEGGRRMTMMLTLNIIGNLGFLTVNSVLIPLHCLIGYMKPPPLSSAMFFSSYLLSISIFFND